MQLVKGDQIAVLDVKPQTYIITFSSRKLLSVDSFQKFNFAYHALLQKTQIF